MEPIIIPIPISLKSNNSNDTTVAMIATSMPIDAIVLPLCADLGELSLLMPIINRIAAATYARFVYSKMLLSFEHF